jgi:hypothetical protein
MALMRVQGGAGLCVATLVALMVALSSGAAVAQEFEGPAEPARTPAPSAPVAPVAGAKITGQTGQAANDTVKGAALLTEARKALGGDDKFAAIKRLEFKGVSRRIQGNQGVEGDFTIQMEPFTKYKRTEEIAIGGNAGLIVETVQALNGDEAWESSGGGLPGRGGGGFQGGGGDRGGGGGFRGGGGGFPGGGRGGAIGDLLGAAGVGNQNQAGVDPERLKAIQRAQRQQEVARLMLGTLMATSGTAAWIGTAQAPEGTADVLEITQQGHPPVRVLLDAKTHLPLMLMWQGAAARGGGASAAAAPAAGRGGRGRFSGAGFGELTAGDAAGRGGAPQSTIEMYVSGYKPVNGVMLPHVISRGSEGLVQEELEIKSYKVNPNFKANTFVQDK